MPNNGDKINEHKVEENKCFIDSKYISQDIALITHGKQHKLMAQKSSRPGLKKQ